jgi:integrase
MSPPHKPVRHAGGTIYPQPGRTWLAQFNHAGRRHRRRFENLLDAKAWLEAVRAQCYRDARPLSAAEEDAARQALEILPDPADLLDAARHFAARRDAQRHSAPLAVAIDRYQDERRAAGRKPRALDSSRLILARLADRHPDALAADIGAHDIARHLDALGLARQTRKNHRTVLRAFFQWSVRAGLAPANPVDPIPVPSWPRPAPGILAPDQLAALFRAAPPELWPALALAAFCGIRTAELQNLVWQDIDRAAQHILVSSTVAKTSRRRYVRLEAAAAAWLDALPTTPFPATRLCPRRYLQIRRCAARAAGIDPWPQNALRHAYASYQLARTHDAPAVAHQLGHRSPNVIHDHYIHLATPAAAAAWFAVLPDTIHHAATP